MEMCLDVAIRHNLERMVPLQEAADASRDGLAQLRREARAEGLNIDAVNVLLPLFSKFPHDKATAVLTEVIRYAEAYGAGPFGQRMVSDSPTMTGSRTMSNSPSRTHAHETAGLKSIAPIPRTGAVRPLPRTVALRLPLQIVVSGLITVGLIWLLA